jgi:hypothetical protein
MLQTTFRWAAVLLLVAAFPRAFAQGRSPSLELEGFAARGGYQVLLHGTADLPDGTRLAVRCARIEQGRRVPSSEQLFSIEAKGGQVEGSWTFGRESFRPGGYLFEVSLQENQPDAVARALTERHRAFRIARSFEKKVERSLVEVVVEMARPLALGLRAVASGAAGYRAVLSDALDGKLASAAWLAWSGKVAAPVGELEKTLARRDLAYVLPAAAPLRERARGMRAAMTACESAARGDVKAELRTALVPQAFPEDDEVTRLLRPVLFEGLEQFVAAAGEITRPYAAAVDSADRTVRPLIPEQQAFVKEQSASFLACWPVFKALPWKGLSEEFVQLMDEVAADVRALPTAKFKGAGSPAKEAKDPGKDPGKEAAKGTAGAPGQPVEAVAQRLLQNLNRARNLLTQDRARQP